MDNYNCFKSQLEMELYTCITSDLFFKYHEYRKAMACLRTSSHKLYIEKGH